MSRSTAPVRSLCSLALVLAAAACGGGSPGGAATTPGNSGGTAASPGATPWPWEAKLVEGATFTLADDDGATVTMKVEKVEASGTGRTYTFSWGDEDGPGPTSLVVTGAKVQVGESKMDPGRAKADESYRDDGVYCFAEDFSNPDGCEDICDAEICFSATAGLVGVSELYAPGFGIFTLR